MYPGLAETPECWNLARRLQTQFLRRFRQLYYMIKSKWNTLFHNSGVSASVMYPTVPLTRVCAAGPWVKGRVGRPRAGHQREQTGAGGPAQGTPRQGPGAEPGCRGGPGAEPSRPRRRVRPDGADGGHGAEDGVRGEGLCQRQPAGDLLQPVRAAAC